MGVNNPFKIQRVTGTGEPCCPGPYTDLIDFTFVDASDGGCELFACSESQSQSISDFSTNYCNIRNLYCGTEVGCIAGLKDMTFVESDIELSPGAQGYPGATADASKCIT